MITGLGDDSPRPFLFMPINQRSFKKYRCTECGHESQFNTNHWGKIYPRCTSCGWKKPLQPAMVHECLEEMPSGYSKPTEWTMEEVTTTIR